MKQRMQGIIIGFLVTALLSSLTVVAAVGTQTIEITYRDIKLYIDGILVTPKDASGNDIEPFIYNGTTYLPIRAIGEALGKEVSWDESTNSAYIGRRPMRDFDQFAPPAAGEEYAVITTTLGVIELRLFPQFAPMAVENFIGLAKEGYYDGLIFHRVIEDFVIQSGDPLGTGEGGESIFGEGFMAELEPELRHFNGALGMARSYSLDSQGSQFYIVQSNELQMDELQEVTYLMEHQDEELEWGSGVYVKDFYPTRLLDRYIERGGAWKLDGNYTVFGQVISGIDVVDKIAAVETDENEKPLVDVVMTKVEIKVYGQ